MFYLAIIPVIVILVFIYVRDKKEKEPMGLLIGLFFAGMGTVISAIILEGIGEAIMDLIFSRNSPVKTFFLCMIVIGPAEELGKYTVLKLITWKNKNFNYSYDAIVYAVFVSLGFAALENIGYVFSNGLFTAIMRMFTAIPGHASFAVFMGFFYSKAKYADLTNDEADFQRYKFFAVAAPILTHGLYDAIILSGTSSEKLLVAGSAVIIWIVYVIILFVMSIITIIYASRNDFCIAFYPNNVQAVYMPSMAGSWLCNCGMENNMNFCSRCGQMRPFSYDTWYCPVCGSPSGYNFCGRCGSPKPVAGPAPQNIQQGMPQI